MVGSMDLWIYANANQTCPVPCDLCIGVPILCLLTMGQHLFLAYCLNSVLYVK